MSLPALAWLVLAMVWGSTWLAVRIGLQDLPPFTFAGLRFLLGSGVLLAALWIRGTRLPKMAAEWRLILVTGAFGLAVSYAAQFWGMQFIPSGLAAVLFSTVPLFTIVFAHAALPSEPLTLGKVCGVTLGIGGVAFIFADQLAANSAGALWGVAACVLGAAALAAAQVAVKARAGKLDPVVLAGLQMAVMGTLLFAVGTATEAGRSHWTWSAALSLAYLGLIGSSLGFALFYWLLKHMEVTKALSMMLIHPPIAILLGWLVLGEYPLAGGFSWGQGPFSWACG